MQSNASLLDMISAYDPSPSVRYGTGAIAFHWLAFLLIVGLGVLGLFLDDLPQATQGYWVNIHGTAGLVYLVVIVARLIWRLGHRPPNLPLDIGEFSRRTSYPIHLLLYALMLTIPAVGIVAFVWHGRTFDYGLFRIDFGFPLNHSVFGPAEVIHSYLAYSLFALATLHAVAALWHYFARKDAILQRMLPGA